MHLRANIVAHNQISRQWRRIRRVMGQAFSTLRNLSRVRASKPLRWPKGVPGVSPARVVLARTHTNSRGVVPILSPRMIAARPLLLVRLACDCALMCLPGRASCVTLGAQRYQVFIIVSASEVLRHNVIHLNCHAGASIILRLACVVITRENARTYACPLVSRAVDRATDVLGSVAIALGPAWSVSCYTHSLFRSVSIRCYISCSDQERRCPWVGEASPFEVGAPPPGAARGCSYSVVRACRQAE